MTDCPIGLQIRALRKQQGWSLAELAQRAGTSAPTLHRYEGGWDRFEVATLRRLAAALGTRLNLSLQPLSNVEADSNLSHPELIRLLDPLFWDRPLQESDLDDYPEWVLRRVLMFGNMQQVEASRRFFGDDAIRTVTAHREIDDRTRNYWHLVLGSKTGDPQSLEP